MTRFNGPASDEATAGLHVPPHSVEAEQSVLGGLLLDNLAWDRAADQLTDSDFYRLEHRLIFSAIGALVGHSKPADVITVFEQLQSHGQADDAGGLAYLNALAQSVPSAANLRRYAEIVSERAILRKLVAASDQIATNAFNTQGRPASQLLDEAESTILAISRGHQRTEPQTASDLLTDVLDSIAAAAEGKAPGAMPTGIGPLDRVLGGGLYPASVYVFAARPGSGKSSVARTILLSLSRLGIPALLLSQEMPKAQVMRALLAQLSRVDGLRLKTGQLQDEDWRRLPDGADELRHLPLRIDDQGGLTLADIRRKARAVKGLKVLILDYLQLCRSTLKNATTNDQVGEISKGLKALAMELGIAVVALSQLNRDVERRGNPEPVLSDLRDSGSIEQDADAVTFLWTAQKGEESRLLGVKVDKNRDGPAGAIFAMRWAPAINEWRESAEPLRQAQTGTRSARSSEL
jgi:replicative DNA helicase